MKYKPLNSSVYIKNREKFKKLQREMTLAVFNSNDILPSNADGTMPFRQNNDLFYLSGIDQEETILLLFPDHPNEKFREILFLKETNEHIAVWEGHKFSKKEAQEISGIKSVMWLDQFPTVLNMLMSDCQGVYVNTNEHARATKDVQTRDIRFIEWCKQHYPAHEYLRAAPIMHQIRSVKSEEEIAQMQIANDLTASAFDRVLKFVKPGVKEYEIEAEYLHEFIRQGSRGFAYTPIIASGANSCVLHYIENSRVCEGGDLLLMDVGAEYGNYNADMTRTIPVSGRFTERQKAVYNAVLRVQREAMELLVVGNTLPAYHQEVGKVMESELIGLGLLDKTDVKNQNPNQPAYKKYFMHGTSHHIGLDVHDVGDIYSPIQENMVFTIEPGIYIPDEKIGIRLENDVVVKQGGLFDLMEKIPIEVEEIEEIMNA